MNHFIVDVLIKANEKWSLICRNNICFNEWQSKKVYIGLIRSKIIFGKQKRKETLKAIASSE